MTTVAALPSSDFSESFEHALATVKQWANAEPTDDEKLEFLEKAIKDLGQPGNVEVFREAMKELGRRAAKTGEAFDDVLMTLIKIDQVRYPGVHPFLVEWSDQHKRVGLCSYLVSLLVLKLSLPELVQLLRRIKKPRFPNWRQLSMYVSAYVCHLFVYIFRLAGSSLYFAPSGCWKDHNERADGTPRC
jgi:hypothetical protein